MGSTPFRAKIVRKKAGKISMLGKKHTYPLRKEFLLNKCYLKQSGQQKLPPAKGMEQNSMMIGLAENKYQFN